VSTRFGLHAIDAVRKPIRPSRSSLGAAPIAYVLLAEPLKHNPHDPPLADRDRSCCLGRTRMLLLYCLLHLTGYDLTLDVQSRSPVGEPHARPPGVPAHARRRGDDRTPRPGRGECDRDGDGRARARTSLQPPGARDRQPSDVRARVGRRPDGGNLRRGGLARGTPGSFQAHLPLRLEQRLARRPLR
jgi:hypothetical protein